MNIRVIGDKELAAAIQRATSKSQSQTSKVLKNAVEQVYKEAHSRAAVDTGFMKKNIKTSYGDNSGSVHSMAGYSGFVEFGTRKMAAQPFMRPAYYKGRRQLIQDFEDVARGLFN